MLKLIIGPAYSGQSDMLCEKMVESSVAHPSSSFIALVPEQSTLKMQRMVVKAHPGHSVMNIDIVSFNRLAHKVFAELSYDEADILNDTGKVLILRKVLEDCRNDLVVYKNKVHMPGFAAEMKSVVTELKQYDIDDNNLFLMQESAEEKGNGLLYAKLQDIRLIYRRFNEMILDRYTTQEEILDVFARLVPQSQMIRGAHIYMDGFTGFTPIQYKLIEELLKCTAEVCVTITLPPECITDDPQIYDKFCLSNQTYGKLNQIAIKTGSPVETICCNKEKELPQARIYEAEDINSEIVFAAKEILHGVRREGMRFRDYAVICSDMDSYFDTIRSVFREAGISSFIDYKSDLGSNSLARYVMAAVQILSERFSHDSVFAYLKSGMTGISIDDINLLENYCLEFGIKGIKAWEKDFTKNRKIYDKERDDLYFWNLEEINRIRKSICEELSGFYRSCSSGEKTAADYSAAILELMSGCGMEEKMQARAEAFTAAGDMDRGKEYEQIYKLISDLLEQIAELMGQDRISAREYSDILGGALEEIKVSIIPPSLDAVTVGDLTRTRLDNVKVLFMIGVNEGKLPSVPASSGLLTQRERDFLKAENFELAPTALENLYTQHYYIYMKFMMPEKYLYLTYSASNVDGDRLEPSYILNEAEAMVPGISITGLTEMADETWQLQAARELSGGMQLLMDNLTAADGKIDKEQKLLRFFAVTDAEVLHQIMSGAFFSNRPLPLDEQTALDLYGDVLKGSVSRYEKFYECPFKHFLNYGLNIQERPEYQVKAADTGTIYHDSLQKYAERLAEKGLSFRNVGDEESRSIASECLEEAVSELENDAVTDTERSKLMLDRMKKVICRTTDVLRSQVKDGLFEPDMFEKPFDLPAGESAQFRGRIDRVDIYDAGDIYVKVIDYKSGSKSFSVNDIYTGQQLQLAAYLGAAIKKIKADHPDRNVKPGGIYYYHIQDSFVRNEKDIDSKFKMSGLTNCDPEVLKAIDINLPSAGSSNIVNVSFTKSGLSKNSSVANETEMEHLVSFVDKKIEDVGIRIKAGEVDIDPLYETGQKNACIYCDYRNVCKFEPGKWGTDYNKQTEDVDKNLMEKEIYGRNKVD